MNSSALLNSCHWMNEVALVVPRELGSQLPWHTASGSGNTAPYAWYSGADVATGAAAAGPARIMDASATATTAKNGRKSGNPPVTPYAYLDRRDGKARRARKAQSWLSQARR